MKVLGDISRKAYEGYRKALDRKFSKVLESSSRIIDQKYLRYRAHGSISFHGYGRWAGPFEQVRPKAVA